jgi:hypothetical protein
MDDSDQKLIREAFRLAWASRERGGRPFAALLADAAGATLAAATRRTRTGWIGSWRRTRAGRRRRIT